MDTFTDTYNLKSSVRRWTFQHLFCIFTYFVMLALPFYFSFAGKNFWFDQQYAAMQVQYRYTGYYALQVNSISGAGAAETKEIIVVPSTGVNDLTTAAVTVVDYEQNCTIGIELTGFTAVTSINAIVFFDVEIPQLGKTASAGYTIAVGGNQLSTVISGTMSLDLNTPFNGLMSSSSGLINRPAYFNMDYRVPRSYIELVDAHLRSEYKLKSESYTQSVPNLQASPSISVRANLLKNTEMVIPYYPSLLETLKLKFSTYLGMLLLSYLIFKNMLMLLIQGEALECHEEGEAPPRPAQSN